MIKRLSLSNRTREAIKDVSRHARVFFADATLNQADHQFVINEFALVQHCFNRAAKYRVFTHRCSQHFARRDMWRTELASQSNTLRALSGALTAKHDDADCIRHGGDSFVKIVKCVS